MIFFSNINFIMSYRIILLELHERVTNFADDCFLFCRANIRETTKIKEILQVYEAVPGQAIDFQKFKYFLEKIHHKRIRRK